MDKFFRRSSRADTNDTPSTQPGTGSMTPISTLGDPLSPSRATSIVVLDSVATHNGKQYGLIDVFEPEKPIRPIADIIFIHGLSGTSHLTWSHNHDQRYFWPAWLQEDLKLSGARVKVFGYDSKVGFERQPVSIEEFAHKLVHEMKHIREPRYGDCPIVFICHSMGGLVAKKAFIIGMNTSETSYMMKQVKTTIFFSTPHRGVSSAKVLGQLLNRANYSHTFVDELGLNSPFVTQLNDEFIPLCQSQNQKLYSFYETKKTHTRGISSIIVDRSSGTLGLGLPVEDACHVPTDHHEVCKFDSRENPRYIEFRRLLSSIISPFMKELADLLSIDETKISAFSAGHRFKGKPGTCSWLMRESEIRRWREEDANGPRILLIEGNAGHGKSFLATYAADDLTKCFGEDRCFYHKFDSSDQTLRSGSSLLRSLAFQAATYNPTFRAELLQMSFDTLSAMNTTQLWERIFLGLLFKKIPSTMFWIIDGLDESDALPDLFRCLKTLEPTIDIRIMLLSRPDNLIRHRLDELSGPDSANNLQCTKYFILKENTNRGMKVYLEDIVSELWPSKKSSQDIVEQVLEKAAGSFLYLSLITKDLKRSSSLTAGQLQNYLNAFPKEMTPYYKTMMCRINEDEGYTIVVSKILTLLTYSFRPLHKREVEDALRSEIPNLQHNIEDMLHACGGFIETLPGGFVGLVHHTARQFLASNDDSILKSSARSHEYIARLCLGYLSSKKIIWRRKLLQLETESRRARSNPAQGKNERDSYALAVSRRFPLLMYAAQYWAYHLSNADPSSSALWGDLLDFLKTDCLTWINTLALLGDLDALIFSARSIMTFIKKSEDYMASVDDTSSFIMCRGEDPSCLRLWARDLIKVVGTLGSNLIQKPTSIYNSILPFCPSNSVMRKAYDWPVPNSLSVTGITFEEWGGCHARLSVGSDSMATRVFATDEFFAALVPQQHSLIMWRAATCEFYLKIDHGSYIRDAAFNRKGNLLCTCGHNAIKVWEVHSGKEVGVIDTTHHDVVLALAFGLCDEEVMVAYRDGLIATYTWVQKPVTPERCTLTWFKTLSNTDLTSCQGLSAVKFSPDGSRVAVSSRTKRVELWDMASQTCVRHITLANDEETMDVKIFNPAGVIQWHPSSMALYLIYHSIDVLYCQVDHQYEETLPFEANTLVCSPCGKYLLASTHAQGDVKIYAISDSSHALGPVQHQLVYSMNCPGIYNFAFSPNGRRFYEVRDNMASVWAPVELMSANGVEAHERQIVGAEEPLAAKPEKPPVTAVCSAPNDNMCCFGREGGTMFIQEMSAESKARVLTGHTATSLVIALVWSKSGNLLASADDSGLICVRKVELAPNGSGKRDRIFKPASRRFAMATDQLQLLFSPDGSYLLISSTSSIIIWDVLAKTTCRERRNELPVKASRWMTHPHDDDKLLSVSAEREHEFTWDDLISPSVLVSRRFLTTNVTETPSTIIDRKKFECHKRDLRVLLIGSLRSHPQLRHQIGLPHPALPLLRQVSALVGRWRNKIVFYNNSHWLCTWDIGAEKYLMHLHLPNNWTNPEALELSRLSPVSGALLYPLNGEVAVVRNWLKDDDDARSISLST